MQVSIWSRDANPKVDPRLCRKSLAYCSDQVTLGSLRWIDPSDTAKGCIATGRVRRRIEANAEHLIAGGGFDTAWRIAESGPGGPLVWQLNSKRF